MAGHVLSRGFRLVIHSRTRARAAELESRGARWADTPADAARHADVVCLCVPDTPDVEKVLLGGDGIANAGRGGQIVIDHSTISPLATRSLAAELGQREITLLDAPISGGDVGARNGTLAIMVGGDAPSLEKSRPVLECYGKSITHCGGSGAGQFAKLVNQILVSVNLVAVCEALEFARRNGLDMKTAIAAVGGGAAASWQLLNLGPKIAAGDFAPGFMIDLLLKDLRILRECAQASGTELPVSRVVAELFQKAKELGHGRDGTQAVFHAVDALSA